MKKVGYDLEFSTTVKIIFSDSSITPSDGFFYVKLFILNEGELTVISTFSQEKDTSRPDQSTVLADFWEEGIKINWYKEYKESDQWVIEVGGSFIVEPINAHEYCCFEEGKVTSLQLEFRRDGYNHPESFDSFEFVSGEVLSVTNLVKNDEDEWDEPTEEDSGED